MRPLLMRLAPLRLRVPLFYRLYSRRAASRPDLYREAPLALAPGVRLDLVPTDVAHGPMAWAGVYELALSRRMRALAERGGLLVDVGANYGYFSCLWASLRDGNRVVAFEASPRNLEGLRRNVERNGLGARVRLEAHAAGREAGEMRFETGPDDQTGWGHLTQGGDGVAVQVVRLDDYCAAEGIDRIDVLKVDVEGADAWVIEGAERLLRERRIGTVFFEEDAGHAERLGVAPGTCARRLRAAGYRVAQVSAAGEFVAERPS